MLRRPASICLIAPKPVFPFGLAAVAADLPACARAEATLPSEAAANAAAAAPRNRRRGGFSGSGAYTPFPACVMCGFLSDPPLRQATCRPGPAEIDVSGGGERPIRCASERLLGTVSNPWTPPSTILSSNRLPVRPLLTLHSELRGGRRWRRTSKARL